MITPQGLNLFITNINTMWGQIYSQLGVDSVAPKIATTIPCSTTQWTTGWTGLLPKARVWTGSRVAHEMAPQLYTVVPRPYELTYTIDRFTLDDDQFGIYYRMLPDMARQLQRWPDYELRDLIEASGAYSSTAIQLGLDGVSNWNTAHPIDIYNAALGTYCNDFTGGGVTITYSQPGGGTNTVLVGGDLTPTGFTTLYEYMTTIRGQDNEVLGVMPDTLMHHPLRKAEAELITKSTFFAPPTWGVAVTGQVGTADNPLRRFGVELQENRYLNDWDTWYLMDTKQVVKPFTWVLREAPRVVPRINENDPVVFDTHTFLYGAWMRATPAWSFPFLAARSGP